MKIYKKEIIIKPLEKLIIDLKLLEMIKPRRQRAEKRTSEIIMSEREREKEYREKLNEKRFAKLGITSFTKARSKMLAKMIV